MKPIEFWIVQTTFAMADKPVYRVETEEPDDDVKRRCVNWLAVVDRAAYDSIAAENAKLRRELLLKGRLIEAMKVRQE